jgi:hypothetical protein
MANSDDEKEATIPAANESSVPSSRASVDEKVTPAREKDAPLEHLEHSQDKKVANTGTLTPSRPSITVDEKVEHYAPGNNSNVNDNKDDEAKEATPEDAEQVGAEAEDESRYLSGLPLLVLILALCLTTFLIGLDQMIIATAIPKARNPLCYISSAPDANSSSKKDHDAIPQLV